MTTTLSLAPLFRQSLGFDRFNDPVQVFAEWVSSWAWNTQPAKRRTGIF
jgi:hypothetical protein